MGLLFILGLIMAVVSFILTLVIGRQFGAWLGSLAAAAVIVPMLVILLSGFLGMLSADAETARVMGDSIIKTITQYVANQMPGIAIADVAGATVGAIGGAIVSMVKGD